MSGHGGTALAEAVSRQVGRGLTTMLPTGDAAWVGAELARRFRLPKWQMAMTATDANRFVLRFTRHLTQRPKIAVMDWCYHGTVDETLVILSDDGDVDGHVVSRPGAIGPQVDPERLEQELVLIAYKMDVQEELDRLGSHIDETLQALDSKEPAGRRLDFLMQELNREANTLSSKSQDVETTRQAVELKVLIEQMREQVQNVE